MSLAITVAGTATPVAIATSWTDVALIGGGSSGSENSRPIVDDSMIGRNGLDVSDARSEPFTATSVGGAARGREARVVKLKSGPEAGRFFAVGLMGDRAYSP